MSVTAATTVWEGYCKPLLRCSHREAGVKGLHSA
jgi:hypothetical protein